MSKNDMITRISNFSETDLENIINSYSIPLDLHPRLPDPNLIIDRLPSDAIGITLSASTFLGGIEDVCMDEGPPSTKKWKNKFFLIDHRAIPDYLIWRHSHSCISDNFPFDGYDQNHVEHLCVHFIKLREINEAILFCSGLSSVWSNQLCDLVFRRKDDNSGRLGVVEEPHQFPTSILERVQNNTTAPAADGTPLPLPTLDEVTAAQPDPMLAKKSDNA
ncbi:hypothetical protein Tco_0710824 [Tanacetum coccineum]